MALWRSESEHFLPPSVDKKAGLSARALGSPGSPIDACVMHSNLLQ